MVNSFEEDAPSVHPHDERDVDKLDHVTMKRGGDETHDPKRLSVGIRQEFRCSMGATSYTQRVRELFVSRGAGLG